MRDAVGAADRLRETVTAAVDAALETASAPPGAVFVGWAAAVDAATCPARYRAQGEDGWGFPGWSPATAAGAVARSALDAHLEVTDADPAGQPVPAPAPVETVRRWMRATGTLDARGVGAWVGELRAAGDTATLAAVAAAASRWLGGFVRVVGWPLPQGMALLNVTREGPTGAAPRWWPRQGSPVSVASGADARIGRVTGAGGHTLVVHRASSGDDDDLRRRAGFEAAAGALALRVAPAAVTITAGDTGERARIVVDEGLLAAGGEMIVDVVRQRVVAVERGHDAADARPSHRCRWCEVRADCAPGRAWVAGPGRWRGGLPAIGGG